MQNSSSIILIKIKDYSLAFPTTIADFFDYFPLSFHISQKFYSQTAVFYKKNPSEPRFEPIKPNFKSKKGTFFERSAIFKLGIVNLKLVELIGNVASEKFLAWDDAYYCCFESDFRPYLLFYTCDNSKVIQGKISNESMNLIDCFVGNSKSYGQDLAKKQWFNPFEVIRMLDDERNRIKEEEDIGKDIESELEKAFERLEKEKKEKNCIEVVENKGDERILVEMKEEKNLFAVIKGGENIIAESKEENVFIALVNEEEKALPKDNELDNTKINSDPSVINEKEIPGNPSVLENVINLEQELIIEVQQNLSRISPIPEDINPIFGKKPLCSPQKSYLNQDTNNELDIYQVPEIPSFKVVESPILISIESFNIEAEHKKEEENKNIKKIHQKTPESKYLAFIGATKKTSAENNEETALEAHNHFQNNLLVKKKTSSCSSSEASINTSYSHT